MTRHLCSCGAVLQVETIGRRPGIVVGYCPTCDTVVMPGGEVADPPPDFPRDSSERREREDNQ